jgi:Big-like domain-containing protein/IPT/TIG domain-containing protein
MSNTQRSIVLALVLIGVASWMDVASKRSAELYIGEAARRGADAAGSPAQRQARAEEPRDASALLAAMTHSAAPPASLAASFYHVPLAFEANAGQTDARVKFLSQGPGYSLFLTPSQATLVLQSRKRQAETADVPDAAAENMLAPVQAGALRLRLAGANEQAAMTGLEAQPGHSNYFIGSDPKQWRTNVPQYGKVQMAQVYPGIDLVFYGNQQQLEYDFVVAPGAQPDAIRLDVDGATRVAAAADGAVEIGSTVGDVHLLRPIAYQMVGGERKPVTSSFRVSNGEVTFALGAYDRNAPLVIDPILSYSDAISPGFGEIAGIAVDASGDAYVAGDNCGPNFPVTPGPFTNESNPFGTFCEKVVVIEFNPTASTLIFSDSLGGSLSNAGTRLALDSKNNVFVTGLTQSTDFPTTAGVVVPNSDFKGGECAVLGYFPDAPCADAFALELSNSGSVLTYSTLLGGSQVTIGLNIKVDSNDQAYVSGVTNSSDFAPTPNGLQTTFTGGDNCIVIGTQLTRPCFQAFLVVLNSGATQAKYSTYFGGSGDFYAGGMVIDASGNVYLAGGGETTGFTVTKTVPPSSGSASIYVGYAAKINTLATPPSSGLVYSVAFEGSQDQGATGIDIDTQGDAYIVGSTNSPNFPTVNALFPDYMASTTESGVCTTQEQLSALLPNNCGNAFVAEIDKLGQNVLFSTFLGGTGPDVATAVAFDSISDSIWVVGSTGSQNFPTTTNAYYTLSSSFATGAFLSNLSANGSQNLFTTLLGPGASDVAAGVVLDSMDNVYVAGDQNETSFPITPGVYPFGEGSGGFLMKFSPGTTMPMLTLSTNMLTFSNQPIGSSSAPQAIMLQNTGTAPAQLAIGITNSLNFFGIPAAENDFLESDNCGELLAAGGSCTIDVVFQPQAMTPPNSGRAATLTILDDAPGAPQTVTLSGTTGNGSSFTVAPNPIVFPIQAAGTSQTITGFAFTAGDVPLLISSAVVGGTNASAFTVDLTNSNGGGLACNNPTTFTCSFAITFNPPSTATGTLMATVTFTDNAPDSPQVVQMSGSVAGSAALSISPLLDPPPQTFALPVAIGTSSGINSITLMNPGTAAVEVMALTPSGPNVGDYIIGQTSCPPGSALQSPPFSIPSGVSCLVPITFEPQAGPSGLRTATITVVTNPAISGLPTITLQDDAVTNSDPGLSFFTVPNPINFGGLLVGETGAEQYIVTIMNESPIPCAGGATSCGGPLIITSIAPGLTDYVLSLNGVGGDNAYCSLSFPVTIPAEGEGCSYQIAFTPQVAGARNTQLTIQSNDPQGTITIPLLGFGVSVPLVQALPASINFGSQATGVASLPITVTLENLGAAALSISSITPSANFGVTNNNCTQPIPANSTCTFGVTVTPPAASPGEFSGEITIADNGAFSTLQIVALSATGVTGPALTLSAASLNFGSQLSGTTSAAQTVTVTNSGNSSVTFATNGVSTVGDFVLVSTTCGQSLAPGATCTATVEYKPSVPFFEAGDLLFTSNAPGSPQLVMLQGNGVSAGTIPSQTALTSSLHTSSPGQLVTFTATVSPSTPPIGIASLSFLDGSTLLGVVPLNGTNVATFTTGSLTSGTHSITASFSGDGNFEPSVSLPFQQVVTGAGLTTQTITVTQAAPASATLNSTFNVAATASSGLPVSITSSGACSGSGTSTSGSTVAITMTSGTGTCTVMYNQAGNANYAAAAQVTNTTTATSVQLTAQTITVTEAAPASATVGGTFNVAATASSALPVAISGSGACTGSGSGSATISAAATGTCTVTYTQAGNTNYAAAPQVSSTTSVTGVTNPAPTITGLVPMHTPAGTGLTLTVNGTGFVSTSTVTISTKAGSTVLSPTSVSATQLTVSVAATLIASGGAATVTVKNPAPGGGTSAAATLTLDDFTLSGPSTTVTLAPGVATPVALTLTPSADGFASAVQLAVASTLPSGWTAQFLSGSSATPGTAGATVTLTVTAPATSATTAVPFGGGFPSAPSPWRGTTLIATLAALLQAARRLPQGKVLVPARLAMALWLVALAGVSISATSCGGGFGVGTQNSLTVTGTSGLLQHSTRINFVISSAK